MPPPDASLSAALKRLLTRREAVIVPGAPDALTARVIEDLGFEAVYVTGAGLTNARLGLPDLGFITLSQLADAVAAIRHVVSVPMLVDADTGFGNALNVAHAVAVLERAGANGIQIEDQVFPKRCGHFAGKQVIPAEEMAEKVRAAADARKDADFQIVARTDAREALGLDAALERAAAYVEAGADATFVEAPLGVEELGRIAGALDAPQVANMVAGGRTPLVGREALREMGFGAVLYANAALQAALAGMTTVLRALRDDGTLERVADRLTPFDERQRLVRKQDYDTLAERYAGPQQPAAKPRR